MTRGLTGESWNATQGCYTTDELRETFAAFFIPPTAGVLGIDSRTGDATHEVALIRHLKRR